MGTCPHDGSKQYFYEVISRQRSRIWDDGLGGRWSTVTVVEIIFCLKSDSPPVKPSSIRACISVSVSGGGEVPLAVRPPIELAAGKAFGMLAMMSLSMLA